MPALFNIFLPVLSVGLGYGGSSQTDSSNIEIQVPSFEFFGQGYVPLPVENLYLRPTARIGYETPDRTDDAQSLSIKESTLKSVLEMGVVHDGLVVPAVSIQAGMMKRSLSLQTSSPILSAGGGSLTRSEYLWNFAATLGVGIPVLNGRIILEPYYRFVRIETDMRQRTQIGVDLSLAIPFESTSSPGISWLKH
ncbi:hypothetical protein EBR21_03190 [bacterium]|nr:hypothetical protein [bacterium]